MDAGRLGVHADSGEHQGGGTELGVTNAVALVAALVPANAGRTIKVRPGTYRVGVPLLVPDGASLEGAGEMLHDADGLPTGFKAGTETVIIADSTLRGDLVTLGDRSSIKGLRLEQRAVGEEGIPDGNVVAVTSRRPSDSVAAAIDECELINPNRAGAGAEGPVGGALLVCTRNPGGGAAPPPHEGAVVALKMTHSRASAPIGQAVFAMNFAARGKVDLELVENVLGGPLDAIGGLSRPDAVHNATTAISSRENLYTQQPGSDGPAWQIIGGSPPPFPGEGASSNAATADSSNDRIEHFQFGIIAIGGRRFSTAGGTCSDNEVTLKLVQLRLQTEGPEAGDFLFAGALSGGLFTAGDENTLRVSVERTTGSGPRKNIYVDSAGFGTDNQLLFDGAHAAFIHTNHMIDPAPPAEFFEHGT